ncbi:3-carboxy-cis,cis-muconate cycloisomerase [Aureimonas frigidaquae]|uniref:3-carboxy-cis,cis-muconate cycloisomerase n=1 Tax=Aureimonas frigidaquae TaxID=424757 RepID=A0A0P0Z2A4_9HYPH|nr:3-carboxy-cis,cis-muconate cycloisomerase [Aureimonas frigidaquae]BAT27838.1 3-carboxy-cis,cis-muconate cycloisomerase [Aureimonas frigidaquae]
MSRQEGTPLLNSLTGDTELAALFSPQAEVDAILTFQSALARAQEAVGLLAPGAAGRIRAGIARFRPDMQDIVAGLVRDGVPVPALVRQLRAAVGLLDAAAVHRGATSQDAVDTGLMLRLKVALGILAERLAASVSQIDTLARAEGQTELMAQTRMQAALPICVADKLATWRAPLDDHAQRLMRLQAQLPLQLGGPVGTGSAFQGEAPRLREVMSDILGLAAREPWHSDRTPILDIAHALALLTGTLGKIGQDIALLAQSDRRAVHLGAAGASSAMAHKRNPVAAEVLVAIARANAGSAGTLQQAMVHENERSGAAWTLEWMVLPTMVISAGAALRHAQELLAGISFLPPQTCSEPRTCGG